MGIAARRASRASECSCAASRNSWPTSETHISWIRTSLRSHPAAAIPHNGSSSQPSAYGATVLGYRQAAAALGSAGKLPRRKAVRKLGCGRVFQRGSTACPILCQLPKKTDSAESSGVPLPRFFQYQNHPFCRNRLQKTTDLLRHRCRLLLVLGNGTRWTRRLAVALLPAVAWAPTAGAASKGAPAINDVGPLFSCVSSFAALRQCANHHSIESAPLHENLTDSPNGISGEGDRGERGVALARRARTPRRLPVPRTTAPAEARPF